MVCRALLFSSSLHSIPAIVLYSLEPQRLIRPDGLTLGSRDPSLAQSHVGNGLQQGARTTEDISVWSKR